MSASKATPKDLVKKTEDTPLAAAPTVTFKQIDSRYTPFFVDDYPHEKLLQVKFKGAA